MLRASLVEGVPSAAIQLESISVEFATMDFMNRILPARHWRFVATALIIISWIVYLVHYLEYALAALLLYGLWRIAKFIFLMVLPFGYPQPLLQASAPGAHAPPPSARDYMFRLGRFQAPQVVLVRIYLS